MAERRQYSDELKAEALKMIIEQGMTQQEVSDLIDVPKGVAKRARVISVLSGTWPAVAQVRKVSNERAV